MTNAIEMLIAENIPAGSQIRLYKQRSPLTSAKYSAGKL
ncbi:hypothetical protein CLV42_107112 [Chitinophaga ginsengisoli]|uniref:Uncharacterized protein n=1 Tax=Chitinophaga ginsengisoli TaxID=363837 RepID=A0A2P8G4V5_9BACT|nr:hypothetical protein CLV42_107112 [Chitinophaga ginsengisoli]